MNGNCSCLSHVILVVVFCVTISTAVQSQPSNSTVRPNNLIVMIGDGQGITQTTAARYLKAYKKHPNQFPDSITKTSLALDGMSVYGAMTTYPDDEDHLITDSAAAGSALSTGYKTYNGAIGGFKNNAGDFVPLTNVIEAAEQKNMATGIVTTSRVTHATPAAFSAHIPDRNMENQIALQQMDTSIEVLLGGGRRHFLPEFENGERADGRNLIDEIENLGTFVSNASQLAEANSMPLVGLFSMSHMDFYLNRMPKDNSNQPSLPAMTEKAIDLLDETENGFVLMVESARIDHLGHKNDPSMIHETLEFDRAIKKALDFARTDRETLVVVTADHETGGMAMGRDNKYDLNFEALINQRATADRIKQSLIESIPSSYKTTQTVRLDGYQDAEMVRVMGDFNNWDAKKTQLTKTGGGWETTVKLFPREYGYRFVIRKNGENTKTDYRELDLDKSINGSVPEKLLKTVRKELARVSNLNELPDEKIRKLIENPSLTKPMLNEQSLIGWTSGGHSGVDVPLYADGPGAMKFSGHHDNTEIGKLFFKMIGADIPKKQN